MPSVISMQQVMEDMSIFFAQNPDSDVEQRIAAQKQQSNNVNEPINNETTNEDH